MKKTQNRRKLIIFVLILLSVIVTGSSFAYWLGSIEGSSSEIVGTFQVGTANGVETKFILSPDDISTYGYLVPENQIENSQDLAIEYVPLQFNLQWVEDNEISQLAGERFNGKLSDDISYDIYINGSDKVLDKAIYQSVYELIQVEKNSTNASQIILDDEDGVLLNYNIRMLEPTTMDDYYLISLATVVFYFNFEVRVNTYDLDLDFTKISYEEMLEVEPESIEMDDWTINQGSYLTNNYGETRLFFPISLETYTITSYASLEAGSNGGYGIFFDTYLDEDNPYRDYGYVLQFDRGYSRGALIIRSRAGGSEQNPVWSYVSGDDQLIQNKYEDPDWWSATHKISITVSSLSTDTRSADIYVDDIYLGSFTYDNQVTGKDIYTGYRGWGSFETDFYSLQVK